MSLTTFENSYARYLLTLPKHVIEKYTEEELSTAEWFNQPDVISGPFYVTEFDVDHYISYKANPDYWKGAPKIDKLNIKIVDGSQLYAGLQSGEIDITQHTMSVIPPEDYASVEALDNVDVGLRFSGYQSVHVHPDGQCSRCESASGDAVCHQQRTAPFRAAGRPR